MKVIYTDVLVIGAGLAGLRMAVGAKRRGHDSIILSLVPPKRSHSKAAQGGMQASLANVIKGVGDNEDVHFGDTVRGSDWGADQEVVRMFVNTAPKAVRELAAWGVPWSRITPGDRQVIINGEKVTITERKEAAGLIGQRDFGGTKKWRTCFVSDGTGHAMLNAVSDRAIALGIPIHERVEAIALIHDGSRCYGAVVRDLITGELIGYVARATAIATGGAGKIFRVSTNAQICEGTGHAIALETGAVTWRLFSSIRQVFSRPVFWLLKAAAVTAVCFATSTAIASCRTLNLKRKNLPLVMLFPVVWKNVLLRARALRAASVNTSGSTSRCSVKTTLNTTFVKFTKSAITSSALTRRRIGSRFARLSTTPWAVSAPTRTANLRL